MYCFGKQILDLSVRSKLILFDHGRQSCLIMPGKAMDIIQPVGIEICVILKIKLVLVYVIQQPL